MANTLIFDQRINKIKLYPFDKTFAVDEILNFSSLEQLQKFFSPTTENLSQDLIQATQYYLPLKRKYEKDIKNLFKFVCNYKKTMEYVSLKKELLGEIENEEELYNLFSKEVELSCENIYHQLCFLNTLSNFIKYANNEYNKTDAFFSISCIIMFNSNLVNDNGKLSSDFDVFFKEVERLCQMSPSIETKNRIQKLLNLLSDKKKELTNIYYQKLENNKD